MLEAPIAFMPETPTVVLPSLVLAGDGVVLQSLLLASERYLCEVRNGVRDLSDFDYAAKNTIGNYRITTWTHEIKEGDAVKASFPLAKVSLVHVTPAMQRTEISYVGDDRAGWLDEVRRAFPVSLLLAHRQP
jgi:hypothetical protein